MEKENENLWLIAVLLLSQNKKLMEDVRPVLAFLEEHRESISLLENMFAAKAAESAEKSDNVPDERNFRDNHVREEQPIQKNPRSPFSGVANDEMLKNLNAYFASEANKKV